ncbi:MAG TPA: hypothetical protein PKC30_01890 [Saprospiraceae bacterium]|mgnify:CR=1 FL=1|nr:hypothetical protein [Saprospiraceae bacterium]
MKSTVDYNIKNLQIVRLYMNYNNKKFRPVSTSPNGDISEHTVFHYRQTGNLLTCEYYGENIFKGHLIGWVDSDGNISMSYHQINRHGQIMTGICHSRPENMNNGKIRLHENWQWTSGDHSKGQSIIEEI